MKIAIAGYGAEGESNYRYWNTPGNQVVIIDERQPACDAPVDASVIVGEDAFARLAGYGMVVRTAGLAPHKIKTDGKIWSATNEFFDKCPAPIIGVTGSKGKGTTCSLIVSILRAAGKTVHLVGNIGVPALDVLADISSNDIVVYELSSFQLWDLEKSPHVAVVLMIEPDHLDVHVDMDEYINAKANIRRRQTDGDYCLYHPTNDYSRRIAATNSAGTVYRYGIADEHGVYLNDGLFMKDGRVVSSLDALQITGAHNIENACAAISAVLALENVDREVIEKGLRDFTGLPHRLKFAREINGVAFYDDSIATTPGSAIAAMKAFSQPKVIILGGSSKGADYAKLAATATSANVKCALVIGDEANALEAALQASGIDIINLGSAMTMREIVGQAHERAETGDVVILSPACASFGMFKNYADRGDQFIAAVENIEEA